MYIVYVFSLYMTYTLVIHSYTVTYLTENDDFQCAARRSSIQSPGFRADPRGYPDK